ncbi:unnamed protein product [Oikopleura dioica]|uniref:Uncharacterized protein n=1 Tax=Oikopleura dioica TaxID=34765 RepID=E4XLT8_OIKDI|nr:unnamed protein product [Oikopleura dioica]
MGFWDIPNLKLYGILAAIFIPFLAIKIWTDLKSKFGILIFLKFNDRSKIGEALVEMRKCFEKGSCVIYREYKQVKIEKYEFLRETSKYKSYSHILWLHCESESHLDYILPKIKQRLNNDPHLQKSETMKLKDIGLAHFFDTITFQVFNKKKTSERFLRFYSPQVRYGDWSYTDWFWLLSLMYTSGMERISRIQGFADYKIIQERFASPSGGLVEGKKESVVFVEVTFPSEDKDSV